MDETLFNSLLQEGESNSLDYKKIQYPWEKAPDPARAELLKDILAFANAAKRSTAYILIGVEEVNRLGVVRGIPETAHLDDSALQQFVNSKTNKKIVFRYHPFTSNGLHFGVISIDLQQGPFYLKQDFASLRKHIVYYRLGSSTEEKTPDELVSAAIVEYATQTQPILKMHLARRPTREILSDDVVSQIEIHSKAQRDLPDYNDGNPGLSFAWRGNRDYWRELETYIRVSAQQIKLDVVVKNLSQYLAGNVKIEIRAPNTGMIILDRSEILEAPSKEGIVSKLRYMRTHFQKNTTCVKRFPDHQRVSIELESIQPGAEGWTDESFFLCCVPDHPASCELEASIFADNLKTPTMAKFTVTAVMTSMPPITFEELKELNQRLSRDG